MPTDGDALKLILADRLIDGRGGPPVEGGAVLVRGSKIQAVGHRTEVSPPEGAPVEVLEFTDKTLIPGMVDCHTHHNGFGDGRAGDELVTLPNEVLTLQSARNARAALFSGVTSARDNGAKDYTTFRLREAIQEGITQGPRLVLCGPPVSVIGGHMGYFGGEVTGPTEARAMVRRHIKAGADYIKITATGGSTRTSFPLVSAFNLDELTAIVREAHKFGKLTATHCLSTQGIIDSLEAGVDMIIHCVFTDADGTDRFREDVAERIGEQGAYINPTVHVSRARVLSLQRKGEREGLTPHEKLDLDQSLRNLERKMEDTRRLVEMGLKVVTGSDSSWGEYKLGNTAYETEALVEAGLSPMQGVVSVTSESAAAIGIDGDVGTLEAGKEADIVVVDGNPNEDISDLWNVAEVFQGGLRIDRGSAESLASLRQHPPHDPGLA